MSWSPELRATLQGVLQEHGCAICPNCQRVLDEDDVSFGGGQTEAGTEFYSVEVECSHCGHELRSGGGWGVPDGSSDWPHYLDAGLDDD